MSGNIISLDEIENYAYPCVLAIGMFDGLHKGHAQVVAKAREIAARRNARPCVLTFSPHPSKVVDMGRPPVKMLFPRKIRAKMFAEAGVDAVFIKKFDLPFAGKTSKSFEEFLKEKFPHLVGIVTGENFVYGRGAEGNAKTLAETAARNGWEYAAIRGVYLPDARRMSSSLMRKAISAGDLQLFKDIAGRNYTACGTVSGGKKLGRTIGFPTLNLKWNPDCKPPFGVYAVRLTRDGRPYDGVANFGTNPTVDDSTETVLETNLFEDVEFGEGEEIAVEFLKFIRPEKKFDSLDALKAQIAQDKQAAGEYFDSK